MGGGASRGNVYVLKVQDDIIARTDTVKDTASIKSPAKPAAGFPVPNNKMKSIIRQESSRVSSSMKVSDRASWLLKEAKLGNLSTDSFEFGRVIGRGLMGSVRIAKLKQHNVYVAVKSVKKDYVIRHNDQRHIQNEKSLLLSLKSKFCITLFGTFQDSLHLHFVLELAVGGELFRKLTKKTSFPAPVAKFYASEIFCALKHIHSLGYVYRDLKPENVLLDEDGHCKLVDFGFAARPDSNGLLHTNCGTPAYLSPEQLNGKFTNGYTIIVDWWSFGILLYELLCGVTPFSKDASESSYAIYLRILENKIKFPYSFDASTKELVSNLCHPDVSKRWTDEEVISQSKYWEISWDLVNARKLVPPHVPRLSAPGDDSHFDVYSNGDKPMEGLEKSANAGSSKPGSIAKATSIAAITSSDFFGF